MPTAATNNQAFFSTGTLILRTTNYSNVAPSLLGVLQDVSLDFDSKNVDLMGQYRFPVDKASGPMTIKGKAKAANFKILMPNLLFGAAVNAGETELATGTTGAGEPANIPGTSPYTVTVVNASSFIADNGVYYQNGLGQLQPVASAPAQGQYSVNSATGVYTFAAADASAGVYIYYSYFGNSSGYNIQVNNTLMGGVTPQFEMMLKNSSSFQGVPNELVVRLFACKSDKLSIAFSNDKWMIPDFEFEAFQDSSGRVMNFSSTN